MKKEHPIEAFIAQGEHQQLDFKFEVGDSKKVARTLSAFANTDGGRLLIGVKDNGYIRGIQGDEEYYMVEAASKLYTQPVVPFAATRWDVRGKSVLEIWIASGADRPYLAPDKDDRYRAYIRVADENILANAVLLLSWEKQQNPAGILLEIGRPVERLFRYLEKNPTIHIQQFCRVAHINYYMARHILSDLLAVGSMRYVVKDNRILYERINR
jgi:hypothetical protein